MFMVLICRASLERTCSVIMVMLRVWPQASEMPSRMVGRSRIEIRSANRFWSTRWTPPYEIWLGIRSATSFC